MAKKEFSGFALVGCDDFVKRLKYYDRNVAKHAKPGFNLAGKTVAKYMKKRVTVFTGLLRDSIWFKPKRGFTGVYVGIGKKRVKANTKARQQRVATWIYGGPWFMGFNEQQAQEWEQGIKEIFPTIRSLLQRNTQYAIQKENQFVLRDQKRAAKRRLQQIGKSLRSRFN